MGWKADLHRLNDNPPEVGFTRPASNTINIDLVARIRFVRCGIACPIPPIGARLEQPQRAAFGVGHLGGTGTTKATWIARCLGNGRTTYRTFLCHRFLHKLVGVRSLRVASCHSCGMSEMVESRPRPRVTASVLMTEWLRNYLIIIQVGA